jgi:hypothetical protein
MKHPVYYHDSVLFIVLIVAFELSEGLKLLTLILLTWRIWWAPKNVSKWQMGFNSAFKELIPKDASSKLFMCIIEVNQILWQCVIYKETLFCHRKKKYW